MMVAYLRYECLAMNTFSFALVCKIQDTLDDFNMNGWAAEIVKLIKIFS